MKILTSDSKITMVFESIMNQIIARYPLFEQHYNLKKSKMTAVIRLDDDAFKYLSPEEIESFMEEPLRPMISLVLVPKKFFTRIRRLVYFRPNLKQIQGKTTTNLTQIIATILSCLRDLRVIREDEEIHKSSEEIFMKLKEDPRFETRIVKYKDPDYYV